MNLHEYQAKQLFSEFGLPVPPCIVVQNITEAESAVEKMPLPLVAKVQVHAGGRGKSGGVKIVKELTELKEFVEQHLNTNFVTYQTSKEGQLVQQILLEPTVDIASELYLGAVVDRALKKIVLMASTEGGVNIEEVAANTPNKIVKVVVDPLLGIMPYQCRELLLQLNLPTVLLQSLSKIITGLANMFANKDLSLVEINPLVITKNNELICIDGKVNVDDNALYRQKTLSELRDNSQEDPREVNAREWELNYIALDGNIGCMVNGAGLAMATMDLIKLHGGSPANFLDVGGGATKARVTEAFKIILSDLNVQSVLVNIFGGIVRCTLIAEGIIEAIQQIGVKVPVIVRLEGNLAEEARKLLDSSGLNIIAAKDLNDAAHQAVRAVGSIK